MADNAVTRAAARPALVVENIGADDLRRLGDWLTGAGLGLHVVRPHAGEALPDSLAAYSALIVLGGPQEAHGAPDGTGAPWFPDLESLLRLAVREKVPTLGICLGGQQLALALGGEVARSEAGPEIGPRLVAKRDAAEDDLLFRQLPLSPDVMQWHYDEITALPAGATLLAASPRCANQAFRIGPVAWGVQFHIECDSAQVAYWATKHAARLESLGIDGDEVVARADAVMDDLEEVWQPFAARFAALALGEAAAPSPPSAGPSDPRRSLPLTQR